MSWLSRVLSHFALRPLHEASCILLTFSLILVTGCISFSPPLFSFPRLLPNFPAQTKPKKEPVPAKSTVIAAGANELGKGNSLHDAGTTQYSNQTSPIASEKNTAEASFGPFAQQGLTDVAVGDMAVVASHKVSSHRQPRSSVAESLATSPDSSLVKSAVATSAAFVPQAPASKIGSKLVIEGVRPERGSVKVAVYTSANDFPNPASASQVFELPASNSTIETMLTVQGTFAVGIYQDINSDGELNRNRFGIPTEPFAFSNNAMGKRGPPSFEQAAVVQPPDFAGSPFVLSVKLP